MPFHLEFEQWVPFPLEQVFAFFSNPENLPRIMPPASGTKLIELHRLPAPALPSVRDAEKAAGVGSTINTSFRIIPFLPLRKRWIARITEFEWNRYFADMQDEGPFKSWHHRHEFAHSTREGRPGTLIRDVIDYEVGIRICRVDRERYVRPAPDGSHIRRTAEETACTASLILLLRGLHENCRAVGEHLGHPLHDFCGVVAGTNDGVSA